MKMKTLTPHQWHLLRQLRQAGCPLDLDHLPPPADPIRVITIPWQLDSQSWPNVFPVDNGVGIVVFLWLAASVSTTICSLRIEADWLQTSPRPMEFCAEHRGKYCLRLRERHVQLSPSYVLRPTLPSPLPLKRGEAQKGLLMSTTSSLQSNERELQATLWITDIFDHEYPYEITLKQLESS